MRQDSTIRISTEPTVIHLAEMRFVPGAMEKLQDWIIEVRPECFAAEGLFPHDCTENGRALSHNELLAELAGRNCYHSYGAKAGKKSNKEYIDNTQQGEIPHKSIIYHAKMTFFIGDVSRRVMHEIIRHYVGADREEEGSPSQESSRYTEHPGIFIAAPADLDTPEDLELFKHDMQAGYNRYLHLLDEKVSAYSAKFGKPPTGMDRKRIYEQAAGRLTGQAATSMVWTGNPESLNKLFRERRNTSADREFQRLANKWHTIAKAAAPNLIKD